MSKTIVLFCLIFYALDMPAQQPLNLNFKVKAAGNRSLPWGWEISSKTNTSKIELDSVESKNDSWSVRMDHNEPVDRAVLTTHLETFLMKGKLLELKVWIKSTNRSGKVFVTIDQWWGASNTEASHDTTQIDLSEPGVWEKIPVKSNIHPEVKGLSISLHCFGKGKTWFSNISLKVNGQQKQQLDIAPSFTQTQLNWFHEMSTVVKTVKLQSEFMFPVEDDDLLAFKRIAGNATIIALGEATHGSSEFFTLKHRLLSYAVHQMGVRIFAIEDHQLVVENVNKYVLGVPGNIQKATAGMFGVWDNQEVYNMIEWVRQYNDAHPGDKVEFVGMDMQEVTRPIDSLFKFLYRRDSITGAQVHQLLNPIRKDAHQVYFLTDSTKLEWVKAAQSAWDVVLNKKQSWLTTALSPGDSSEIEWGIQYANLVRQFTRESLDPMALYRDKAMAENISWILSHRKPDTKILLWAHDVHISRGEHPDTASNYHGAISMGSWLAKKYGDVYKAIGLFTYNGAYRAFPSYSDYSGWINCPLFPGPVGSLDEALHQVAMRKKSIGLLLNLSTARSQQWLTKPLPTRFANHVCMEYAYWTRFSIPYQFDAIYFIDRTSPALPVQLKNK
jgi:erythromycin esterase